MPGLSMKLGKGIWQGLSENGSWEMISRLCPMSSSCSMGWLSSLSPSVFRTHHVPLEVKWVQPISGSLSDSTLRHFWISKMCFTEQWVNDLQQQTCTSCLLYAGMLQASQIGTEWFSECDFWVSSSHNRGSSWKCIRKKNQTSLLLLVFLELKETGEMKQGANLIQEGPQK